MVYTLSFTKVHNCNTCYGWVQYAWSALIDILIAFLTFCDILARSRAWQFQVVVPLNIWCILLIFENVGQIGCISKTYVMTDFFVKQTTFYTSATRPLLTKKPIHAPFRLRHGTDKLQPSTTYNYARMLLFPTKLSMHVAYLKAYWTQQFSGQLQ